LRLARKESVSSIRAECEAGFGNFGVMLVFRN
jgi:hypothetical protein